MDESERALLERAYVAFNSRDVDAALALMHPDVDWPNAFEGGRVSGHDAVRDYWQRQWTQIDPRVEPRGFADEDGRVVVEIHQLVKDMEGNLIADQMVEHVFEIRDGLVARMDVRETGG